MKSADGTSSYQKELSAVDGGVYSVVFARDGTGLVAGRYDSTAKSFKTSAKIGFWPESGAAAREITPPSFNNSAFVGDWPTVATQLALSPDGNLIAARSYFGIRIIVCAASDGKSAGSVGTAYGRVGTLSPDDDYADLAFSPDGKFLAAGVADLTIARVDDWSVAQKLKGTERGLVPGWEAICLRPE